MALMDMTEDLLQNMAISINGTYDAKWMGIDISLKGPFQRLDIMDTLQEQIRLKLYDQSFVLPNIDDQNASQLYLDLVNQLDIKISLPHTLNRLVDWFNW